MRVLKGLALAAVGLVFAAPAAAQTFQTTISTTGANAAHFNLRNSVGTEIGTASAPLRIDPVGTTSQPVSGTVTANAGTGTLAVDVTDRAARLVGQIEGRAASGAAKAGNPVQVGGVFNATQPTVTTGQAVEAQATARGGHIVATGVDAFNVTVNVPLPTGSNVIGALTANQSVNVAQIAATNTVTAAAGVQRVGIAGNANAAMDFAGQNAAAPANALLVGCMFVTTPTTITSGNVSPEQCNNLGHRLVALDAETTKVLGTVRMQGNVGGVMDAANNAAAPANVLVYGVETITASGSNPTSATSGNVRRVVADIQGNQFVRPGGPNIFTCRVAGVTATTQCQAAPASGLRAYVTDVFVANNVGTAQTVDVVFGTGTACATGLTQLMTPAQFGAAVGNFTFNMQIPLVPTAANAICLRPTAATSFSATLTGYIAP